MSALLEIVSVHRPLNWDINKNTHFTVSLEAVITANILLQMQDGEYFKNIRRVFMAGMEKMYMIFLGFLEKS